MSRLTILMATYNGEQYLIEQLNSFNRQNFKDWDLWVSDDGSTDTTKTVLKNYADTHKENKVVLIDGLHRGFARNFLNVTCLCQNESEYFAFSDQDDIWNNNKLEKAVNWLEKIPKEIPALFCSRTEIVDSNAKSMVPNKYSKLMVIEPSFENALVQCIAGGNTMVFNRKAKQLIEDFGGIVSIPSHDWWLYLLVTGTGGSVYYDTEPLVKYRQHQKNAVGTNQSIAAIYDRLIEFLDGKFKKNNDKNMTYLCQEERRLTKENLIKLKNFLKAKQSRGLESLKYVKKSGAIRNDKLSNLVLKVGAIIGKI